MAKFHFENDIKEQGWGTRHVQSILLFICLSIAYTVRTSMSVAVIAMTDITTPSDRAETFDWGKQVQDYILASFFWGYMIMQIPAGQLAFKYGGKRFIAFALFTNGIISFVVPTAAKLGGWKAIVACRILQGFSQGCLVPSLHTLLGKWAPLTERNRMGNFVYTGGNLGTIIAMPLTGFLASTQFGWPSIFYISGFVCLLIGIIWLKFGADSPATHGSIAPEEKYFIESSLGQNNMQKSTDIPFREIFTSVPVLALLIAHVGSMWGFLMMLTETPSFLKMALGINVENSGLIAAVPYTMGWIFAILTSIIADYLLNKKIYSNTTIRKLANTIGTWVPAFGMLILTVVPAENYSIAILIIVLIVGTDAVNCSGFLLNHIDLSPNYSGVLMSFSNCIAAAICTLAPISTGYILDDPTDIKQWHLAFIFTAGVYFVCNLIFIIFGSGDKQPWDSLKQNENGDIEMDVNKKLLSKNVVIINNQKT